VLATPVPEPIAKTETLETRRLGAELDRYERAPNAATRADVHKALAELDGEIAELEQRVARTDGADRAEAAAKLRNLRDYRQTQTVRFAAMQGAAAIGVPPAVDARTGAEKAQDSARKAGNEVEDAAKKAADTIKDAGEKIGDAIKDAAR